MSKGSSAALRKVGGTVRPALASSAVGESIAGHLRSLQAARQRDLDVDAIVGGLRTAVVALVERGLLVSVSRTRDERSVRLSALIDGSWVEWFSDDLESAEDLSVGIRNALDG